MTGYVGEKGVMLTHQVWGFLLITNAEIYFDNISDLQHSPSGVCEGFY
jgi:hypothetical protein